MTPPERIAIIKWSKPDGQSLAIGEAARSSGYEVVYFDHQEPVPENVGVVFTFGPYHRWTPIPQQLSRLNPAPRPLLLHWNFEGTPPLNVPHPLIKWFSLFRSAVDRLNNSDNQGVKRWLATPPLSFINTRFHKFRFIGDTCWATQNGLLDRFVTTSYLYAELYRKLNVSALVVPWGTSPLWHASLGCERDIDVLWMGKRRTTCRSKRLDAVREQLAAQGVTVYMVDGIERPFIYGDERTHILNRAKITLNLLPTWYDNNFPHRFHLAAANKSLVISDPLLPHHPAYQAGTHYVEAASDKLVPTILFYLRHSEAREKITSAAYHLATSEMTLEKSVHVILSSVAQQKRQAAKARTPLPTL